MRIRIAGIEPESVVDGVGVRFVVFVQGCLSRCEGCHNRETWDPEGGREVDVEDLVREFSSDPLITGITISGGEPFLQLDACSALAKAAHKSGLSVWCYTGYKIENLMRWSFNDDLLNEIDVLVDGEFQQKNRSYDLRFRGSTNQRIIYLDHGRITKIESEDIK